MAAVNGALRRTGSLVRKPFGTHAACSRSVSRTAVPRMATKQCAVSSSSALPDRALPVSGTRTYFTVSFSLHDTRTWRRDDPPAPVPEAFDINRKNVEDGEGVLWGRFPPRGHKTRWGGYKKHSAIIPTVADGHQKAAPIAHALQSPEWPDEHRIKKWRFRPRRTGLIGRKIGMSAVFDKWGVCYPCTIIQVEENQVIQVKPEPNRMGFVGLQIGAGPKKHKRAKYPELMHCLKAGVPPKLKTVEFRVSPEAILPPGLQLFATHFTPGQYLDIAGITRGKGFAGVMKRWHFKGGSATHGNSKSHRSLGSTGPQGESRVIKGKKMPGRMGNRRRTQINLLLIKIDVQRNLLYVHGAVPGAKDSFVEVKDAMLKELDPAAMPPWPTHVPTAEDMERKEILMAPTASDPFMFEAS